MINAFCGSESIICLIFFSFIHYARCDTRLALIILRRQVHPPGPNEADPTGTFISKIAMKKSHVGSLLSVQLFVRFSDKHHHDVQFLLPKW